jgi:molybdopterin-guanine dinucleotide biosynthesis protein A
MANLPLVAGILVGGKSTRYGRPKAHEVLPNGKTVLTHVIETARLVASEVVLLGDMEGLVGAAANCRQFPDQAGTAGPIAGLASLLSHAKDQWALLLACDLPLLEAELFSPLFEEVSADASVDAAAFGTGLPRRPLFTCCALYHPRIAPTVRQAIDRRELRLQAILQSVQTRMVQPTPSQIRMLQDMNTPEDKSRLLD